MDPSEGPGQLSNDDMRPAMSCQHLISKLNLVRMGRTKCLDKTNKSKHLPDCENLIIIIIHNIPDIIVVEEKVKQAKIIYIAIPSYF